MSKIASVTLVLMSFALGACSSSKKSQKVSETPAPEPSPTYRIGKPHNRLYQGYQLRTLPPADFEKIFNDQFLPLFPWAHPKGLIAYRPALPLDPGTCTLPSEVALLTFASEEAYNEYRESEVGKRIRDAHSLVFRPDVSKSLVPVPYRGQLKLEQAYDLAPAFSEYVNSQSVLYIHCNPALKGNKLIDGIQKAYAIPRRARNILFTVSPQHVIEYVFFDSAENTDQLFDEAKERFKGTFKDSVRVFLKKDKVGGFRMKANKGLDAQWND